MLMLVNNAAGDGFNFFKKNFKLFFCTLFSQNFQKKIFAIFEEKKSKFLPKLHHRVESGAGHHQKKLVFSPIKKKSLKASMTKKSPKKLCEREKKVMSKHKIYDTCHDY
jgi:hypothetical protein